MDWAHAYQLHQRDIRAQLEHGRRIRRAWVRLSTRMVLNPARLSDREIQDLALRDAEFTVNMAINQGNEQLARKGR